MIWVPWYDMIWVNDECEWWMDDWNRNRLYEGCHYPVIVILFHSILLFPFYLSLFFLFLFISLHLLILISTEYDILLYVHIDDVFMRYFCDVMLIYGMLSYHLSLFPQYCYYYCLLWHMQCSNMDLVSIECLLYSFNTSS